MSPIGPSTIRSFPWSESDKSRLEDFQFQTMKAAEDIVRFAYSMLHGSEPMDVGLLLRAYIYGVGAYSDPARHRLHEIIDEIGAANRLFLSGRSFFQHRWAIKQDVIERFCPEMAPLVYGTRSNSGLTVTRVLEPCPNEALDMRLPKPLGSMIHRPWRAAFEIFSTDDAVAYVHPFHYQLLSKDLSGAWASASPRSLSRCSIPDLGVEQIDGNIIIIQDRFAFFNLCHFLYDGISRILHYIATFGSSDKDLFILGSIPGEYHQLVCETLCDCTGISLTNLYFPTHSRLLSTSKRCFWFSDQVDVHAHPAQMAHPRSITELAAFCRKIPAPRGNERAIYISRGDAHRRKVANEEVLKRALEDRGFVSVQLSRLRASEQIELFRGADIVIGPHGMGLTHIIMGERLGRLIELFHPTAGTDAYAFVAHVAGIQYDFVIGNSCPDTPGDFDIDPDRVLEVLGPEDFPLRRPSWKKAANLIPASRSFQGFFPMISDIRGYDQQMIWGEQVRVHHKRSETEVGRWSNISICANTTYTASCWVLIPAEFPGSAIFIRIVDWADQQYSPAKIDQLGVWQRIFTTAVSIGQGRCQLVLDIEGDEGATVISTCWQFEAASRPTSYVSTG